MRQHRRRGAEQRPGERRRGLHQLNPDRAPLAHPVVGNLLQHRTRGAEVLGRRLPAAQRVPGDVETVAQPLRELVRLQNRLNRLQRGIELLGERRRELAQSLAGLFDVWGWSWASQFVSAPGERADRSGVETDLVDLGVIIGGIQHSIGQDPARSPRISPAEPGLMISAPSNPLDQGRVRMAVDDEIGLFFGQPAAAADRGETGSRDTAPRASRGTSAAFFDPISVRIS